MTLEVVSTSYGWSTDDNDVCPVLGRFAGTWMAGLQDERIYNELHDLTSATKTHVTSTEHARQWRIARWIITEHTPAWFEAADLREEAIYCRGLLVDPSRRLDLVPRLTPLVWNSGYDRARHQPTLWPYKACPELTVLSGAAMEASRCLPWQRGGKSTDVPPYDCVLAARMALHRAFVLIGCLLEHGFDQGDIARVQLEQERSAIALVKALREVQ